MAAAQANFVVAVPSSSSRAISPLPRAEAPRARSSPADSSTGSSPQSLTLASSSTVSYALPPVTAHTSRQNGSSACSPSAARVRPAVASEVNARRLTSSLAAAPRVWRYPSVSPTASSVRYAMTTRTGRPCGRALGEGGEPRECLQVGPLRVVDDENERSVRLDEPSDQRVQPVPDTLRVGVLFAGRRYAQCGTDDLVPVAEEFPCVRGAFAVPPVHRHRGQEQLPYGMERDGGDGLTAARGPDRTASCRHPAYFGEQRGLAESRRAPVHEHSAGGLLRAQGVDRAGRRREFGLALQQGEGDRVFGPVHRRPSSRTVCAGQVSSLAPECPEWT